MLQASSALSHPVAPPRFAPASSPKTSLIQTHVQRAITDLSHCRAIERPCPAGTRRGGNSSERSRRNLAVSTVEGIFEADLDTLKQWIVEGCVLPTDKVSKGSLSWIEAGRAPMLRGAFNGEVGSTTVAVATTDAATQLPPAQIAPPVTLPVDSPDDSLLLKKPSGLNRKVGCR